MSFRWTKLPFLRWSFWRKVIGIPHLLRVWQVGDGREERLAQYVLEHARKGDPLDVLRIIDQFGWDESILINVGDEKGVFLDEALQRANAQCVLELGTYCGYSALRMAIAAPHARIISLEFNPDNADIARRIHAHAGVDDRVTVVVGTLGDNGVTIRTLREAYGLKENSLDLVFIDHNKTVYLPDLLRILSEKWLRPGGIAVADNMKLPGSPEYRRYMKQEEGKRWRTTEHHAHLEYQSLLKDSVFVSEFLGG